MTITILDELSDDALLIEQANGFTRWQWAPDQAAWFCDDCGHRVENPYEDCDHCGYRQEPADDDYDMDYSYEPRQIDSPTLTTWPSMNR